MTIEKNKLPFKDETLTGLRELSQRKGVPMVILVEQAVEALLTGTVTPITQPREVTLEDAADLLLQHMDAGQAALIKDLCAETGHQPSDYLLSYIFLAHERGETAHMIGEHVMVRQEASAAALPALPGEAICDYCHKAFRSTRQGQKYCPDPDDGTESCGRRASLEALHWHRAKRLGNPNNEGAPRSKNIEVYRRAAQQAREMDR